jgi:hypothetical protein
MHNGVDKSALLKADGIFHVNNLFSFYQEVHIVVKVNPI